MRKSYRCNSYCHPFHFCHRADDRAYHHGGVVERLHLHDGGHDYFDDYVLISIGFEFPQKDGTNYKKPEL